MKRGTQLLGTRQLLPEIMIASIQTIYLHTGKRFLDVIFYSVYPNTYL